MVDSLTQVYSVHPLGQVDPGSFRPLPRIEDPSRHVRVLEPVDDLHFNIKVYGGLAAQDRRSSRTASATIPTVAQSCRSPLSISPRVTTSR